MVSMGLGPIVGSSLGGVVFANLGPSALFVGAAGCAALGAVVVWLTLSPPAFSRRGEGVPAGS
jgi:hypothetical protein